MDRTTGQSEVIFLDNEHVLSEMTDLDWFSTRQPFPHVVIDGMFRDRSLRYLASNFPRVEEKRWWKYENPLERKYAFNDLAQLDPAFSEFFAEVSSPNFIAQLEELTGLTGLIPDPSLLGGGLHQICRGGKLDVHEDFNVHRDLGAFRKLNLIVYLNEGWREEWGGHLELWNEDVSECVQRVSPVFNRSVLFRTDCDSNHGHPNPLACPESESRKSLAIYYYVPCEDVNSVEYRSTTYKKLPHDPENPELDDLRERRKHGRIENKTT